MTMAETVLVFDDNIRSSAVIREGLANAGFRCLHSSSLSHALLCFDCEKPEAAIVSLHLACGSCVDFIDHIKAASPHTVVLALGAKGGERRVIQALKAGADDYLQRPTTDEAIARTLRRCLNRAAHDRMLLLSENCDKLTSDHLLERIFYEAPAALLLIDCSGGVTHANRAAGKVLGIPGGEITGVRFDLLLSDRVREDFLTLVRKQAHSQNGFDGEIHLKRGDGGWFPARLRAIDRPEKDHLLLFIEDLTKQKSIENRLYESKRLASLGHVVEGVAHEVRNPLISIGGFVRKLQRECAISSVERKYTAIILNEVERLERMVSDIEDYVKFAKSSPPEFTVIDGLDLLKRASSEVKSKQTDDCGIRILPDQPEASYSIFGDEVKLVVLFTVLLQNAAEATHGCGEVTVRIENKTGWLTIKIEDTGSGIAPGDLEEIYNPFFTSKTDGVGLGLAKAFMIVEDHEGVIHFESELGKGTICTVNLPVDRRRVMKRTGF